jgi:hypothetical protein
MQLLQCEERHKLAHTKIAMAIRNAVIDQPCTGRNLAYSSIIVRAGLNPRQERTLYIWIYTPEHREHFWDGYVQ